MNYQTSKESHEYINREQIDKLLSAAKEGATRNPERDHAILTILANHGLRVSELCNLRISDINLGDEPAIYVRHEKGGEPSAHPLYKSDITALRKWLAIRNELEVDHDYLYVSEQLTRINRATINLMIDTVSRKAGLEHLGLHPHSLRSACASHLLNQQHANIREVQDYLGHRSVLTTQRYCKLAPGRFEKFAKAF